MAKKDLNLINEEYTEEFFFYSTFNIIPIKYRPYKLFVISRLLKNNNKPILLAFFLLKYLEQETYDKLFLYLNDNFKFKPKIIHSDYEHSLSKSI